MYQNIQFPKSSFFEFYCNEHRLTLAEYRSVRSHQKLDELAEYYDDVTYDIVNQVFIVEKNGKLNFVYETELAFAPVLYDFCHIYPGFAVVRKGNQMGNLFFHEGLSEPSSYRTVNVFEVKRGNYFGVETASGDWLMDCIYRLVKVYPDFILAISDEGFLLFHPDGRRMFEECFNDIDLTMIYHDYLFVQKDEQWGVVHVRGYWIVPALFRNRNDITHLKYCIFSCHLNGKKVIYIQNNHFAFGVDFDDIHLDYMTDEYLLSVSKKGKLGMIDRTGTFIIPCVYDKIYAIASDCYRIINEGTDSILQVPHISDFPRSKPVTTYQHIESCCCDFAKMPHHLLNFGDAYAATGYFKQDWENVDYKEAIRWFLMYSVFYDHVCDQYYKILSGKYKALTSKKSDELLSLFQLKVIRSERGNVFSSIYRLAGIYFEGKEVITNYRYAIELYIYCIEYLHFDDENGHTASFEKTCDVLINRISQDEPVNVFDDCWSDEYRQCALIAHRLGWMLYTGNGVEKDETMGMKLLNASKTIGYVENKNVIYYPSEENDDEVCPF